jgi:cytochrome c5
MGLKIGAAALLFVSILGWRAAAGASAAPQAPQKTTRDKVYTSGQATRGADLYGKTCDRCHDPAKAIPGKKPAPVLIGAKFIETWGGRGLDELFTAIYTTMPSDGSVVLTDDETIDLIAHLLKANGLPEGPKPLPKGDALKGIAIAK